MDIDGGMSESSKYNEAGLQILRLHGTWTVIESNISKGQLNTWKFLLDSIWRELYADIFHLGDSEARIKIKENERLKDNIAKAKTKEALYDALNERHLFLKRLQDEVGKGGVYDDGTEDDFD